MIKSKALIVITLVGLLTGCKKNKEDKNLFDKTYYINSKVIIDDEKTSDPSLITVIDTLLVISNTKQSPLIEVYNITSGKPINSFLSIGNGPNEVLIVGSMQYNALENKLLIADLFKRTIFSYNIEDITNGNNPTPTIKYKREKNSSLLFDKLYTGKDLLIAESRDPRGRILLLNKENGEARYYLEYPNKELVDKSLSDINNARLYASTITINPSLDKIALATYGAGIIDICKIDTNKIIPQWNYTAFYPQGIMIVPMVDNTAVAYTRKSRNGFISIDSSEKYIYALFSGKLLEDPTYPYGNEVYVISWDGKENYKLSLDKSINRLAIDANDKFIYGITPEMEIVEFEILKNN